MAQTPCKATHRLRLEALSTSSRTHQALTPAWADAAQWRALHVGVDSSAHFLRTWQAWRADPQRPRMLHVVAICDINFLNTQADPALQPLAEQLDAQLWGLLPGFHRLVFEAGQVLLTVCVGAAQTLLKQQQFEADEVCLHRLPSSATETLHTVKSIARLCRRGTTFVALQCDSALAAALKQCGFEINAAQPLQATYRPAWVSKKLLPADLPTTCIVIGAGLAGAAVASSLARRGWAVTVLDTASAPASGASSLPAGLLVPHTSPDDGQLSRLSRCGVRTTLQQARAHLRHGIDWGHTGVLQRSLTGELPNLPPAWADTQAQPACDWAYPARPNTLAAAGLPHGSTALWHAQAGWVKPAALVNAWLATPGVQWQGNAQVAQLQGSSEGWRALNDSGQLLAQADMLVVSAGYASRALAAAAGAKPPDLQPIRGQLTLGSRADSIPLPPFPVNGNGGLIPNITAPGNPLWLMGASYDRDAAQPEIKPQDHLDNLTRLRALLPQAADALANQFNRQTAHGWAGVRCATPNRLPLVMPLQTANPAWLCTGMGSRGLSFAALCGELLAAYLHHEPLPIERQLADAMRRPAR